MTRFLVLPVVVFSLLGGALVSAQTIGVRSLALRSGELPEVYLKGAKNHLLLEFSSVQPSEVVRALRTSPLPLYRKVVDDEGAVTFSVAHKIKVPSGAKGILLLGLTSGKEVRFVPIADDFGSARYNDWLLINAGQRPIAFSVGQKTKPVMIAPGASTTHRISVEKGKGAAVLAQAPFGGKAKTFFSTYWPVHAGKRTVVLFVDDGKKIRVKRISDKLAPVAKPEGG
jgi:hypothetical protein